MRSYWWVRRPCLQDYYLEIRDGNNQSANVLGVFCGDHKAAVVRSSEGYLWLRFFPSRRHDFSAYYTGRSFNQTATPTMTQVPKTQTVIFNRTSNLWCPVEGAPAPYIVWRKNGVVVQNSTSVRYQLVAAEKNVNYSCEVRRDNNVSRSEISLNIEECPGPCDCHILKGTYNLLRVSCTGKELMSFPWKIPLTTATLDLSNNQLNDLPKDIFSNNTHLSWLNLGQNKLKKLPQDIFSNYTKLKALLLNNNQLNQLPSGIFSNYTQMELLWLDNNHLKELSPDIFDKNFLLRDL
nr:uncharacterized protein LOC131778277 [Pocillopora verrucosa]